MIDPVVRRLVTREDSGWKLFPAVTVTKMSSRTRANRGSKMSATTHYDTFYEGLGKVLLQSFVSSRT